MTIRGMRPAVALGVLGLTVAAAGAGVDGRTAGSRVEGGHDGGVEGMDDGRAAASRQGSGRRPRLEPGPRAVQEGRRAASATRSASESEGTGLAPDLTGVASKFTRDFILQSILEPSATLNGQFFHTTFTLKNGDVVTGSVIDIVDKKIIVAPVMMNPQATVEIAEADVKSEAPSPVSPMPAGLLNELTKEQIVELMAFLDVRRRSQRAGLQEEMSGRVDDRSRRPIATSRPLARADCVSRRRVAVPVAEPLEQRRRPARRRHRRAAAAAGRGRRRRRQAPARAAAAAFEPIQEYPADPNEVIQALNGFKVEIVAKADRPTQGSWISITEDDQGRLILGANEQQPFTRLTLDKAGKVVEDRDDLHAGLRGDGHHLARQRALRPGRPAREDVHADDRQPRLRTAERTGRPASAARSEGRRQLHDRRHAAHVGRRRRRPQRSRHPRGAGVAGRQALLHHQRQRRGPARRHVAELAAAQLRRRPHHPAARRADRPAGPREGARRHDRADDVRRQGLASVRRRHAQRAALRLERRRRDLLVRQRHGAGVRRALVPAGARVLAAERRRPRLSRQQRQVPDLVRGLAAAAGRDRPRQPGRRDVRLPHRVSGAVSEGALRRRQQLRPHHRRAPQAGRQRLRRDVVGELHLAEVALRRARRACRTTSPT